MKPTFIAAIAGAAVLAASLPAPAGQGSQAIRKASSGQTDRKIHLRQTYDSDASRLVGSFIPDDVRADAITEGSAFRSACSDYLVPRAISAGFKREDELLQGNIRRRIEYSVTGKLTADIQKRAEFARCCAAHPGQCPRRYIDSALKGELFDRTLTDGKQSIRETQGEQYFGFTVALLGEDIRKQSHCDAQNSWADQPPVSMSGTYFVGASSGNREAALESARSQAAAAITLQMESAKTQIEQSMGSVALQSEDMVELTAMAQRFAGDVQAECWAERSGDRKVLAFLSSETLEAARQAALNFYASRTQGAVASALDRSVQELISLLPTGTGIRRASVGPIADGTVKAASRGKSKAPASPSARSEWLADQLAAALSRRPNDFVLDNTSAASAADPRESVVIRGKIAMRNRELVISLSAAVTGAKGKSSRLIQLRDLAVPEGAAPKNDDGQKPLTLKIANKSPDGTLCAGQQTSITVSTDQKRYVQIWNLYGPGCENAVLIYPAEPGDSGFVLPGKPLVLSDLTAMPTRGSTRECFIAVAGASKDALGELGKFTGCSLGAKRAKKLLDKGALRSPARNLAVAEDEYLLSEDASCAPVSEADMAENEAALAGIPRCP